MAKVKIQGNASGTGVLTITAPNTSTDRTITLPDTTGTLLDENSSVPAANLTGTVADARISALTASKLTGALPALDGSNLTGVSGGKVLKAAFTNTLQKTGTWTDTTEYTILSLAYTPASATSTLYITSTLTFQLYGASAGVNFEFKMHTKEGGTTIVDGRDLHWNTYSPNNLTHFTPHFTQVIARASSSTSARTYTLTLQNSISGRRLLTDSYYPHSMHIIEVEA